MPSSKCSFLSEGAVTSVSFVAFIGLLVAMTTDMCNYNTCESILIEFIKQNVINILNYLQYRNRAFFNWASNLEINCFGFALLHSVIGLKNLGHLPMYSSQPIRCKTKTNPDLVTCGFPHLALFMCISSFLIQFSWWFKFVSVSVYVCCDWPLM